MEVGAWMQIHWTLRLSQRFQQVFCNVLQRGVSAHPAFSPRISLSQRHFSQSHVWDLNRPIFSRKMERPQKRQRTEDGESPGPESLTRPISPPTKKRREASVTRSPWQLTWIRDLPEESNQDAVTLKDLLGDPLISECWEFNFLHDIHFLMDAFDTDTRHLVKVHVVHGFWKREDPNRLALVVNLSVLFSLSMLTLTRKQPQISTMSSFTLLQCQRCLAPITPK